jgi:hypothetical protein
MKNKVNKYASLAFALGLALLISACGQKSNNDATASTETNPLERIQLLDTKPSSALAVKAAREQLKPGDQAVVFGQIGGAEEPFFQGYAGFILADTDILFCNETGDDHCPTPWDACCEDPDKLKSSRASVQFVDAGGLPLATSLQGYAGLEPLRKVVVTGTVASSSTPENLIIEARGLYLESL